MVINHHGRVSEGVYEGARHVGLGLIPAIAATSKSRQHFNVPKSLTFGLRHFARYRSPAASLSPNISGNSETAQIISGQRR